MQGTKEKYNNIITEIETHVKNTDTELSTTDIAALVSKNAGMTLADLTIIMRYMTNKTLREYIKERQLMNAYHYLISSESFNVDGAIARAGYDNQSSFNKAFKELFKIKPKDAFIEKNKNLFLSPLTWEKIEEGDYLTKSSTEQISEETSGTVFGISSELLQEIKETQELQIFYDFDDLLSGVAYQYAKKNSISLKKAFEYVADFGFGKKKSEQSEVEFTDFVERRIYNREIEYGYFKLRLSVSLTFQTIKRLKLSGEKPINELEPNLSLLIAISPDMSIGYCKTVYNYYKNKNGDYYSSVYEYYIDNVWKGMPYEDALEEAELEAMTEDFSSDDFNDDYKLEQVFSKEDELFGPEPSWIEEETNY